jgi:hypothetical protein
MSYGADLFGPTLTVAGAGVSSAGLAWLPTQLMVPLPHDAGEGRSRTRTTGRLREVARDKLARLAKRPGLMLKQTHQREGRTMRQRTILGSLMREIQGRWPNYNYSRTCASWSGRGGPHEPVRPPWPPRGIPQINDDLVLLDTYPFDQRRGLLEVRRERMAVGRVAWQDARTQPPARTAARRACAVVRPLREYALGTLDPRRFGRSRSPPRSGAGSSGARRSSRRSVTPSMTKIWTTAGSMVVRGRRGTRRSVRCLLRAIAHPAFLPLRFAFPGGDGFVAMTPRTSSRSHGSGVQRRP